MYKNPFFLFLLKISLNTFKIQKNKLNTTNVFQKQKVLKIIKSVSTDTNV